MVASTTEGFHVHVFARDSLDDVRAGNEHVGRLVHHDDVVRQGRGVCGAASRRAHDHRDLRDDARCVHVIAEDVSEHRKGGDTLLDAGATAVEQADNRHAVTQSEFLNLDDLLAVDVGERAAEDREVLRVDRDRTAVYGSVARHEAVAERVLLLHPEGCGAVLSQRIELNEGAWIQEHVDAFAGGVLAAAMLPLNRGFATRVDGLSHAAMEVLELTGGRC